MLPPFRAGVGGPVAGGRQYVAWIALADLVGLYLAALDDDRYDGAFNATAPAPATNAELSRALGRALHRPAVAPVPAFALRALYGQMAEIVTASQNAVPARALALGHAFALPALDGALRAALRPVS
jgi:NAD dependent epimerase/dehydratase family enzyme